jgi:hypothetical protein
MASVYFGPAHKENKVLLVYCAGLVHGLIMIAAV